MRSTPASLAGWIIHYFASASDIEAGHDYSRLMLLDKVPIDLDAKTRQVVQMEHAVAHGWSLGVQTVVDRITLGISVRFCRKGTGTERRHDVGMQMGRAMGRDAYPVLLCQGGDA